MVRLAVLVALLGLTGDALAASLSGRVLLVADHLGLSIIRPESGPGPVLTDSAAAFTYSAAYEASFGRLRGRASVIDSGPPTLDPGTVVEGGANGEASFADVVTINAAGLAGTTGTLQVRLDIRGSMVSGATGTDDPFASLGNADWLVNLQLGRGTGAFQQRYGGCSAFAGESGCAVLGDPFGIWTTEVITFTYGQPMELALALFATTGGRAVRNGSFSAVTDLSTTVEWLGLEQVLDANGVAVTSYSVTSESGTNWALPVPEPAIALLLALGLPLALGSRSWRRPFA